MFYPTGAKFHPNNDEQFLMSKLQTFDPRKDIYQAASTSKGNKHRKPNRNEHQGKDKEKKRVSLLDQPVTDNKGSVKSKQMNDKMFDNTASFNKNFVPTPQFNKSGLQLSLDSSAKQDDQLFFERGECFDYKYGFCLRGPQCQFRHIKRHPDEIKQIQKIPKREDRLKL